MNADGTNQQRLTNVARDDLFPDWHPNAYSYSASTAEGQNVSVTPISNLSLTFSNVLTAGNTTATVLTQNQLQPLPSNFSLIGSSLMYDITTLTVFSDNITVTFDVLNVTSAIACSQLRILHYTNNDWDLSGNATPVYNTTSQSCTLAQTVTSLSPFVVAQSNPPTNTESMQERRLEAL
jgi:hypothetical protein